LADIIAKAFVLSNHNGAWQRRAVLNPSIGACFAITLIHSPPNGNRRSALCAVLFGLSTDIASRGIKALRTKPDATRYGSHCHAP
jgi:hypothetical protein